MVGCGLGSLQQDCENLLLFWDMDLINVEPSEHILDCCRMNMLSHGSDQASAPREADHAPFGFLALRKYSDVRRAAGI